MQEGGAGGRHLKERKEFMWAHSLQTQSVLEGVMCRQESEAAGGVASMFSSRGMNAGPLLSFSVSPFVQSETLTHGILLHMVDMGLSTSRNPF